MSQVQENEVVRLRMVQMSAIPDTLYMVEEKDHAHCVSAHYNSGAYSPSTSPTVDNSGTVLGKPELLF